MPLSHHSSYPNQIPLAKRGWTISVNRFKISAKGTKVMETMDFYIPFYRSFSSLNYIGGDTSQHQREVNSKDSWCDKVRKLKEMEVEFQDVNIRKSL